MTSNTESPTLADSTLRPVARRYEQFCAIAKALDALGDRWALLIVRDLLLFGTQRYTDLFDRLPGISTDMLATRLRELEEAGVVKRSPAAGRAYELTERGRELEPVLESLAVWGFGQLRRRRKQEAFEAEWLIIPLRALFDPARAQGTTLHVQFQMGSSQLLMAINNGSLTFPDQLDTVDVTVTGGPDELAAAVAQRPNNLDVSGASGDVAALLYVLGLSDAPPLKRRVKRTR